MDAKWFVIFATFFFKSAVVLGDSDANDETILFGQKISPIRGESYGRDFTIEEQRQNDKFLQDPVSYVQ